MAKGKGTYIKLDRGIRDNWVWESKPFSPGQAWVDLLMDAAYVTTTREWKGSFLVQNRGEVFTSMVALADRWGWSYKKVGRFIRALEMDGMVQRGDLPKGTRLTIENYTKFQGQGKADGRAEDRASSEQATEQRPTIKENKRNKKKKEETRARDGDYVDVASLPRDEIEELERLTGRKFS